uniref:Sulfotransferase n=1 Tax=Candidatus Methanogaster sp. ANME-2c ERB4 TaxID=2759911 RepID=A0A7G9YFM3_9EURY|nr:hypothetical protein GHMBFEBI_00005 [Methanosarcinales archaeon ANME-2c ERB4]QNO46807.1 hypothetical protein FAOAFBCF_00005 [Methanosarcinales archaeon ANME-2c ERB4]
MQMQQIDQNNGPIFVVGSPRSGTTLLQRMLRSHPRISSPTGESHFMIPLYRNAKSFGDLRKTENVRNVLQEMYHKNSNFLETDFHGMRFEVGSLAVELCQKGCDSIPRIISGLFEKNAHGEGKARWLEKTPYYVLHLPTILEMFPDAQIIHIIRDGRDCALSMFGRKYDFDVFTTYHAAWYWKKYVDKGKQTGPKFEPSVYLEIRYEDLVTDPVTAARGICGFLGENYSDSIIQFQKSTDKKSKTPFLAKPIQAGNVEKWRRLMTPHQIKIFESVAGDTLKRSGYPCLTKAKPMPRGFRAAYVVHDQLVTWFHQKILGPQRSD